MCLIVPDSLDEVLCLSLQNWFSCSRAGFLVGWYPSSLPRIGGVVWRFGLVKTRSSSHSPTRGGLK